MTITSTSGCVCAIQPGETRARAHAHARHADLNRKETRARRDNSPRPADHGAPPPPRPPAPASPPSRVVPRAHTHTHTRTRTHTPPRARIRARTTPHAQPHGEPLAPASRNSLRPRCHQLQAHLPGWQRPRRRRRGPQRPRPACVQNDGMVFKNGHPGERAIGADVNRVPAAVRSGAGAANGHSLRNRTLAA